EVGAIFEHALAPKVLQAIEVHWIDLLLRMDDREVMLVGELLTCENHRDADGSHQADEGELDAPLRVPNAIIIEKIVETLVPEALNVVRGHVVDRLRPIGEAKQTAVDQFAHRPFETRLLFVILSHDCIPNHPLELFVPEAVEAVLAPKINRHRQILTDHEEAFVGTLCRQTLRHPPRAPYGSGKS